MTTFETLVSIRFELQCEELESLKLEFHKKLQKKKKKNEEKKPSHDFLYGKWSHNKAEIVGIKS